jgi:uncharacterized membrane protein (UPF0127 family)
VDEGRVVNARNGRIVLSRVRPAQGPWQRLAGLMFAPSLPHGEGLIFRPARGVHTHFMRFAIDLVYLDQANRVCAIRAAMPPWRVDLRTAAAVIEANAGTASAADLRVGDLLHFGFPADTSARAPLGTAPAE